MMEIEGSLFCPCFFPSKLLWPSSTRTKFLSAVKFITWLSLQTLLRADTKQCQVHWKWKWEQFKTNLEEQPFTASVWRQTCPHTWHQIIKMNEMSGWFMVPATLPVGEEPQRSAKWASKPACAAPLITSIFLLRLSHFHIIFNAKKISLIKYMKAKVRPAIFPKENSTNKV